MRKIKEVPAPLRKNNPGAPVKYLKEAEILRKNPEQWYELKECASSASAGTMASQIRAGKYAAFPAGFEAVSRGNVVYIRFVG